MNTKRKLRSADWFNDPSQPDQTAIYIERYLNYGLTREELQSGRPIIGIAQTGNDLTPCNRHHMDLARRVREGIRDAGGVPFEFPVHPIAEMGKRPTAALDRNLAYLGLVEILYGYPLDGVVLTTGCDKTTPATLMAAAAVDIPAIVLSGGPMLNGWGREDTDQRVGSGSIIWTSREDYARGDIDYEQFMDNVTASAPSVGHCNTMGTALTMNSLAEAMGMSLPGCAAIPATYKERPAIAFHTGKRIVDMVFEDLKPSDIMTRESFLNAIRLCSAIGGSTNAPPHLQAIANRLGVKLSLEDWQDHGEEIPLLVNCQPAGEFLGEDFYRAGGVPAVMGELLRAGVADGSCRNVSGKTLGELYGEQVPRNEKVILPYTQPLMENAGFAVMRGNLFDSAIMKKSVIGDSFREHYLQNPEHPNVLRGRAIVFEGPEDYHHRIDDPALEMDEHCILVIRNCGPLGYPGSAEVVNMRPPDYLIKRGVTGLPCIGDGRQSGTSASPSILNASPEAAAGGGLALLQTDDRVQVDLNNNRVDVLVSEEELQRRRADLPPPQLVNQTPWQEIYRNHVTQLDEGGDMKMDEEHIRIVETHGTPRNSH
ncbi:IlvD/Edd family dehydratase [Microbulbifer halophilus]|uniref:IlvD/Edd family dehydratase n=3 Tax=Microbulbifer halophilus TaxID=453963 RepID=A0ABW5E7E3_9GAMM|nr:IlvD/Edd family dehydratase [Microbulbifer halophilus]MCW8125887.1 dihydroxy-acid dehydratase family protein [Microbulbifer halophilus]